MWSGSDYLVSGALGGGGVSLGGENRHVEGLGNLGNPGSDGPHSDYAHSLARKLVFPFRNLGDHAAPEVVAAGAWRRT